MSVALDSRVLVLNRTYLPVNITSVRRAISLMYRDVARAVDGEYRTFDFQTWARRDGTTERIGMVDGEVPVPRVILLTGYDRVPQRYVRFSRVNVYARDRSECQYCGRRLPRVALNLDHVVPRSRGGRSGWENVVCSCIECNRRKGDRTPAEAGMRLVRRPYRPQWTPFVARSHPWRRYEDWLPFLHGNDTRLGGVGAARG